MEHEIQVGDVVRLTGKAGTAGRNWELYSKECVGDYAVELVTDEEQCAGCDCISGTRDAVKPNHYEFPGGVRVFQISQWLTANIAQAVQYLARSSRIDGQNKGDALEDLQKAKRFIDLEIARLGDCTT